MLIVNKILYATTRDKDAIRDANANAQDARDFGNADKDANASDRI